MENKSPLSPHIQIYRWHISSLVSISHRITGIINIIAKNFPNKELKKKFIIL
jgi:succinate dehydrogenase / fumarate reductase cytochrome b subunit